MILAGDGGESREFNPFRSVPDKLPDLTGKKILVTGIANNRSTPGALRSS